MGRWCRGRCRWPRPGWCRSGSRSTAAGGPSRAAPSGRARSCAPPSRARGTSVRLRVPLRVNSSASASVQVAGLLDCCLSSPGDHALPPCPTRVLSQGVGLEDCVPCAVCRAVVGGHCGCCSRRAVVSRAAGWRLVCPRCVPGGVHQDRVDRVHRAAGRAHPHRVCVGCRWWWSRRCHGGGGGGGGGTDAALIIAKNVRHGGGAAAPAVRAAPVRAAARSPRAASRWNRDRS